VPEIKPPVPAFKAPYAVKVVQYYDRKCGITVFDAEIGGERTMICRRDGAFCAF